MMDKLTLKFSSIKELTGFVKTLNCGYLINTNNCTVTAKLSEAQRTMATGFYSAFIIETNDKVYSYDVA